MRNTNGLDGRTNRKSLIRHLPTEMLETAEMMRFRGRGGRLAGKLLQELLLIQPVLKGLPTVNKDDWDFVGELAAKLIVGLDVHFAPAEAAPALEFGELLLHDLAQVAAFAGIYRDFTQKGHRRESSKPAAHFP